MQKKHAVQRFSAVFFCDLIKTSEVYITNLLNLFIMKNIKRLLLLASLVVMVSKVLF